MTVRAFQIRVADKAVSDLQARLALVRWPSTLDPDGWDDGASLSFMKRLVDHWRHRFDWRDQEERLNRLPNHMASVEDQDIHFVHQPGRGPSPMPLILTHGWPGSFVEFEQLIPMLADPASNGGDPDDAFHVVVPSLPGYGFSPAPRQAGMSSREIAALWHGLMVGLGYDRFGAQGGDIGAGVSTWLARLFPDSVSGIHLNYVPGSYRPARGDAAPPLTSDEQAFLDRGAAWSALEGAYAALQATKPQTLSLALTDSPVGLAGWIVEKFRSWSDCGGDIESRIPIDALLTDISLYWFGDSLTHSLRLYKENRLNPLTFAPGERIIPPVGVAVFPHELPMPPRSWVERVFDVDRWTIMPAGGHFAALEQPRLLAEDIRAFFRPLRSRLL
ncbi:epoxide hydrolase family protein [Inquilinus sp.]|jgi:pimeloyl-ACP methyl ester carboxylesterase|uniref:epoxide hydrolase family protein n=1 Tax=Inquilinus sp. TaxID=1932117 RepID=UPI00378339DA